MLNKVWEEIKLDYNQGIQGSVFVISSRCTYATRFQYLDAYINYFRYTDENFKRTTLTDTVSTSKSKTLGFTRINEKRFLGILKS